MTKTEPVIIPARGAATERGSRSQTSARTAKSATAGAQVDQVIAETYQRDGVVRVPGLLDLERYVDPLLAEIAELIAMARKEAGLGPLERGEKRFDAGLAELLRADRRRAGLVYDAVRRLPAFFDFAMAPPLRALVKRLLDTDLPGWFAQGSGPRMDHPGEEAYLSPWHQDYHAHLGSPDSLVVWAPLVQVDEEVGPVVACCGSHLDGMLDVHLDDPLNRNRNGARAIEFIGAARRAEAYRQVAFETEPGDVLAFHGLMLHRSSPNRSKHTRWSLQLRFLNFRNPAARQYGWMCGMNGGHDVGEIHPEIVRARTP